MRDPEAREASSPGKGGMGADSWGEGEQGRGQQLLDQLVGEAVSSYTFKFILCLSFHLGYREQIQGFIRPLYSKVLAFVIIDGVPSRSMQHDPLFGKKFTFLLTRKLQIRGRRPGFEVGPANRWAM
jgi:hypothetical protein